MKQNNQRKKKWKKGRVKESFHVGQVILLSIITN